MADSKAEIKKRIQDAVEKQKKIQAKKLANMLTEFIAQARESERVDAANKKVFELTLQKQKEQRKLRVEHEKRRAEQKNRFKESLESQKRKNRKLQSKIRKQNRHKEQLLATKQQQKREQIEEQRQINLEKRLDKERRREKKMKLEAKERLEKMEHMESMSSARLEQIRLQKENLHKQLLRDKKIKFKEHQNRIADNRQKLENEREGKENHLRDQMVTSQNRRDGLVQEREMQLGLKSKKSAEKKLSIKEKRKKRFLQDLKKKEQGVSNKMASIKLSERKRREKDDRIKHRIQNYDSEHRKIFNGNRKKIVKKKNKKLDKLKSKIAKKEKQSNSFINHKKDLTEYQVKQTLVSKKQTEEFIEKMDRLTKSSQGWGQIQKSGLDKIDPQELSMEVLMKKLEAIEF